MFTFVLVTCAVTLLAGISAAPLHAAHPGHTLVVTMTNDAMANQIKVYDATTGVLLQTISTHGKGGVAGNARASSNTEASWSRS
jgi:hypothetical protein